MSIRIRPIPNYPGYSITNTGRVFGPGGGKWKSGPRELAQRHRPDGFREVFFSNRCPKKSRLVNQLVLEAFVGPRPEGMWAMHLNGDRADNVLTNLEWRPPADVSHGTIKRGTKFKTPPNHRTKLSHDAAGEIRRRTADGESSRALAEDFGVNRNQVSNIRRERCWTGPHAKPGTKPDPERLRTTLLFIRERGEVRTTEIADHFGMSNEGVIVRLRKLGDRIQRVGRSKWRAA